MALAHFKEEAAVPDLIALLEKDDRPVIRGTAAWALGRIGGKEAHYALFQAKAKESDEEVRIEIDKGLQFFQ